MGWSRQHGSLDFRTLRSWYAAAELTPEEVVAAIYDRIEARGEDHVWISRVNRRQAQAQAGQLGRWQARLPLYGLPFAVKDNIDVAGLPTTAGCPEFAYSPASTAPAVAKLIEAGAILVGKTNLDQFATGLVGVRSPYGACANPFDARYIAGGSSSGSAVAVSAGLVSFALGTDTAGSARVPAACTNIVGLKPTRGLLSTTGVVPACRSLDCVSILALTSEDAETVFTAAKGFDPADPYARSESQPAPRQAPKRRIRFGAPRQEELAFFGDSEAPALYGQAIAALEGAEGGLVEIEFAPFREAAGLLYDGPWVAERLLALREFLGSKPEAFHPVTRTIISQAARYSAVDAFEGFYRLEALKKTAAIEWDRMDILVLPTTGTLYTVAEVEADPYKLNANLGYYTNFVNLMDLCALALPAGFRPNGLPFGISLIAPPFHEPILCSIGQNYHRRLGRPLGATNCDFPPEHARR